MVIAAPHPQEEERLASLLRSNMLDTPRDRELDRLIFTAAQIFRLPIVILTLIDAERQWFKSAVGVTVLETRRDIAFCAHTILQSDIMIVEDATKDLRFHDNPLILEEPFIRFYAGVPVLSADGFPVGSFCIIDRLARQIGREEIVTLKQLAHEAEILIRRFSK